MTTQTALTLINPQNGNLAFKIFSFDDNSYFDHVQRHNYYSIVWLMEGKGKLRANVSAYDIAGSSLLFFSPYQPFMINADTPVKGITIHFHSDFFCIHKHQAEVACNGILFNNIYQPPIVTIDEVALSSFTHLLEQMKKEMHKPALAQYELLVSYLKILLINASRLKVQQHPDAMTHVATIKEPFVLQTLKEAIETHFRSKHSASDYSAMLNISVKALAKLTKNYFNKTLTDLIAERIVIEAKRELYLTTKPVKQIAAELGYDDEYYFSRFFKTNADISPQSYRDTVGFGKGLPN